MDYFISISINAFQPAQLDTLEILLKIYVLYAIRLVKLVPRIQPVLAYPAIQGDFSVEINVYYHALTDFMETLLLTNVRPARFLVINAAALLALNV